MSRLFEFQSQFGTVFVFYVEPNAERNREVPKQYCCLDILMAKNVSTAQQRVVEYWLKWQDEWDKYKGEVEYSHVTTFEVEDLATDLENILTSTILVTGSDKFKHEIQKLVVRMILPTLDEKVLAEIDDEIEKETYEGIGNFFSGKGAQPPPGQEEEVDENGNPIKKANIVPIKKIKK